MADTIYALATPPGRSGIAVIRLSGEAAFASAARLGAAPAPARRAMLRRLRDPRDGQPLDDALVLRFEGPASYTGEDVVELQFHGGPAVSRAISSALAALPGMRLAEPGEFTRRALINGKLDLAQVEGVGDLLAAETSAQARQAVALIDGALSAQAARWRDQLVHALALIEATIDFAEEDLPDGILAEIRVTLGSVSASLASELAASVASERLREGFEIALVGAPNVGKSTLLNFLAGREAALTSAVAGTTRDVIEVRMDLGGLPVTLIDTAGLRETDDPLESLGVARARQRAEKADLRVVLVDGANDAASLDVDVRPGDCVVLNKADLRRGECIASISGVTGEGVAGLLDRIVDELAGRIASGGLINRERQRAPITRALESLGVAGDRLAMADPHVEVAAAEITAALRALDVLVGRVDVELVLDAVFRNFCIGK